MGCIGYLMSRSVRTTAAYVIGSLLVTLPSFARLPSISLVVTDQHASACGLVARKLPGTMTICCLFLLAVFMRSPWTLTPSPTAFGSKIGLTLTKRNYASRFRRGLLHQ